MEANYYIDESGNSGDVLSTGTEFEFNGQPFFSLACIGIDDTDKLDQFVSALRSRYKINSLELKSTKIYKRKPKFIADLVGFLCKERIPILIEVVDKKYYISANIVNCHVMPPCSSPAETPQSLFIRNHFADFVYNEAPNSVFEKFINACKAPSNETLFASFTEISTFAKNYFPKNEHSIYLSKNIQESIDDYNELKLDDENAYLKFIPVPDSSKRGKSIWMLPNLASFTNIYARINLYLSGNLSGVNIFHDEQAHFDEIITINKKILEELDTANLNAIATAKYGFNCSATLKFSESHEHSPIQIADILAGMVMRYLQETVEGIPSSPEIISSYKKILSTYNPNLGLGVNLVVTKELHHKLNY